MLTPIPRKRRTREHIIAGLSVNHVERQVLLCGHTVERVRSDYGYDLLLTTFDREGEPENGELHLQLKATDSLRFLRGGETISWKLSRADLARWIFETYPVILIVYDAQSEVSYWQYVQRYFQLLPTFNLFSAGQTVNIHVPKQNVFNQATIEQIARYRDSVDRQFQGGIDHNARD